ncbi:alpha-mannosidase [Anaerocolumna jejuensis DSM 15929]|uniref:Alpha-mannosidase n=1 Tax=Anaerocolumna jejuensis DSM 15929 TaxID=1121322 RepID=A0A1M6MUA6_9FIRM|nr:alpha-mannosidase [Anaerocolumna jejuensis]SHJ86863.1 alpha-mannosidase [Anaerocolumna jejuensis DSM 15929]
MVFLDKRIRVICDELKKLSVVQKVPVDDWKYKKGNYVYPRDAEEAKAEWEQFDCKTMHWYGPDEHYWFRGEFTVPQSMEGKAVWMNVKTQIEEWDDGKNPQFLLYVDNTATQGIDMNHRRVLLTKEAVSGKTYHLDLQSYTGTLHSEFNLIVEMLEIDPRIEKLYYDISVPLSAFTRMEKDDKVRRDIEAVLNNCINLLDLRNPYSKEFYDSLGEADAYLEKALYEDMAGYEDVIATCIGHTHIDVAWWWTVEQTREKVGRSFATVLKLMEEYPNYKFMSSQPQLYYFLKERYPELYARLKERVKEGRWEPEGGMWVEADCNLTSGESLVRQFLHGKKFFKEEFGVDNRVLWLPDVFGYSGALPQIMKKSGIDYFMTTKLAWNQFNKIPNDTMYWKGIDGTQIFTHLITTLGVGQSTEEFFTTYNGMLHPDSIMGGWTRYQNKDINNDILISYGYGDGGGGPTREMLETSIRMEKGVRGIPKVRQEFAGTYFEELFNRVKDNKRLAVWEGEFYFEYHRGTYTSMARNKRSNRKSELMLMDLELLSVLSLKNQVPYPAEELDAMWKKVLLNQFHDILPGSSIKEVYEVTKKEYAELAEKAGAAIHNCLSELTGDGEGVTVYNTLGFLRDDIVNLGDINAEALKDTEGNIYPVQKSADGAVAYLKGIPSKGSKTFETVTGKEGDKPFYLKGNHLETPYYTIELDEQGLFTSIYDKENDREVLQDGQQGNLFRMYEDKPIYYDNWDIDIFYTEKFWDVTDIFRMEWTEIGEVRATLEIQRNISSSVIRQKIYFYAHSRRIEFNTYVDWKEHQHLLKVHFPVNIHSDEASFDIQFGNLTRKVHSNTSWDTARFESCGHKWIDLSEGHYGVSLLNDCKYGHSVKDGNMAITLIKSGIEPNPATDQEEHYFTYAIYPHAENWRAAGTVFEAAKLNQPAYAVKGGNPGAAFSFVSVNKPNVMIETVKQAEDGAGVILRIYEYENALTKAHISLAMAPEIVSIEECNLIEEVIEAVPKTEDGFDIEIKPYEIKTYKVKFTN